MIKTISIVKKRPDITREEFYGYWKDVHGPLVARHIPGLRKYIQNHYIEVSGYNEEGDGIIETWYDDVDSFLKSMEFNGSDEARELGLGQDWAKIADMGRPKMWVVDEHVIRE